MRIGHARGFNLLFRALRIQIINIQKTLIMILISHRGHLNGPIEILGENNPEQIDLVLRQKEGYHVEIDVWLKKDKWYLGHDIPCYRVYTEWLQNPRFWCHAKDIPTLNALLEIKAHCFFHDADAVTLTSQGYMWTYPGQALSPKSICVLPEQLKFAQPMNVPAGICSDYIKRYANSD